MTTTTFMGLELPTVSSTIGPIWAQELNTALGVVDSHDHSSGKGQQVPTAGININADLSFNSNRATNVGAIEYINLSASVSDLTSLYVVSGDLFYNDAAGNAIRLTSGGAVNVGSLGSIGGDYSTTPASLFYTDSTKKYTFNDSAAALADVECGDVECGDITNTGNLSVTGTVTVAGSATLNGTTTVNGALNVSGAASFTGNTSGRGILPVGSIVPLMSNLTGITDVTATTVADANGFVVCGGQTISDPSSPLNGETVPNINDDLFVRGASTAGTTGGSNSFTLTEGQLPAHTHSIDHGHADTFALSNNTVASSDHSHDMSHTHQWGFYSSSAAEFYTKTASDTSSTSVSASDSDWLGTADVGSGTVPVVSTPLSSNTSFYTTGVIDAPSGSGSGALTGGAASTTTVTLSGAVTSHSGDSGSTGAGSSIDNRPSFITAKYVMRIK